MPDTNAMIGWGITFEFADAATPTSFTYIAEVTDFTLPSDTTDQVDVSHMQSPNRTRQFISGLTDPGECSFEMNLVPGSASDLALQAAKNKRKWCRVTFPNGCQCLFWGERQTYERSAPTDDKMTASVSFKVSGEPVMTAAAAPRNITAPTLSDTTPNVGAPVTCDPGIWAGAEGVTYQWKKGSSDISGATSSSYIPVSGDIGSTLACTVTAANDGFTTSLATANSSNVAS